MAVKRRIYNLQELPGYNFPRIVSLPPGANVMSTPIQTSFNVNNGTDGTSKIPVNASNMDIRSLVLKEWS